MLAAPRGFEPRFTDPKSAVLPLDEGAAGPRDEGIGAEDGVRTRDLNLGKVALYQLSYFRVFNMQWAISNKQIYSELPIVHCQLSIGK